MSKIGTNRNKIQLAQENWSLDIFVSKFINFNSYL